ncbi:hypothetical protein [Lysobacter gummosus]
MGRRSGWRGRSKGSNAKRSPGVLARESTCVTSSPDCEKPDYSSPACHPR